MIENLSYYKDIFQRYLNNNCTPAEAEALFIFLEKNESDKLLLQQLREEFEQIPKPVAATTDYSSRVLNNLLSKINEVPVVQMPKRRWSRIAVAAAAVAIVISGYLFFNKQAANKIVAQKEDIEKRYKNDIAAGGDKAILVLGNGQSIVLDSAANGTLTQQGNTKVLKLNNGQLSYASGTNAGSNEVLYNSIVTPRGGQYLVVLPDGTNVWLNASSSLRFPTAFVGKERRVEITGEAYFEVQKNKAMPFIVAINGGSEVEVTGTHFNIMAYEDELTMKTTLLEGGINLHHGNEVQKLKPGQQAQLTQNKMQLINDADVDQAIAWKNGLFDFNDDVVPDIMRQLSRWYDIDVAYEGKIPDGHYVGSVRRKSNISEVLKMLELAGGIHFEIQGKKVIVKK
ncbi:FecR family protein [Ferruginibacter profundus]